MKTKILGLLAVGLLAGPTAANASLMGSTVNVSVYYPTISDLFQAGSDVTVSGGVEYPAGSFTSYNPLWSVDITDTQFRLTWNTSGTGAFSAASFNGFALTIISGPTLLGASVAAGSQFNPVISIVGNRLFLNYSGLSFPGNTTSIVDVRTANSVPEPGTLALLGLGLAGLGLSRRRRAD